MHCNFALQSHLNNRVLPSFTAFLDHFFCIANLRILHCKNRFQKHMEFVASYYKLTKTRKGEFVASCYKLRINMDKYERTTSFRFPEDIYSKLDILYEYYSSEAKRIGGREKTKTEIMQEAVNELYYKMINKTQDADTVDRINRTIDDKVNTSLNSLRSKIDEILFLCIKNDLGNKLLYRCPDFIKCPSDREKALDMITEEEAEWDNALEEAMMYAVENDVKDKGGK